MWSDTLEVQAMSRATDPRRKTTRQRQIDDPPSSRHPLRTHAQLTLLTGSEAGRAFTLPLGITIIGRADGLPFRLDDPGVSWEHARLSVSDGGAAVIEDLGSTNGSWVGERRLEVVERVELRSGDRIRLGGSVALSFAILDSEAERMTRQLYESSMRDALTQAYNRRHFDERLASEVAYSRRHATALAVVLFDVDHFKQVNDSQGHLAGDRVLRDIAQLVSRTIRREDVLARFGGEEFVVIVRGIDRAGVGRLAERLRASIESANVGGCGVTISLGHASLDEMLDGDRSGERLLQMADARLYRAKSAGRNRTCGEG